MIPLKLTLSGFISYRDATTLDFTPITLACISGHNGAGKSTLLDAMTWALFGQARQRGDAIVNTSPSVKAAEVTLEFAYEGNVYRVFRRRERGKSTTLEFQLRTPDGQWKPLTRSSMRETQAAIEATLRMDYDTFTHASFFLQGEADKFSRERPAKRKQVLAGILGLQVWEDYRQEAVERRRHTELEIERLDARMEEMRAEIQNEASLQVQVKEVEADITRLTEAATAQEAVLRERERAEAALAQQETLVATLTSQIDRLKQSLEDTLERLEKRTQEQVEFQTLLEREAELRAAYDAWKKAQADLAHWEEMAARFRDLDAERQPLLRVIQSEEAKLREALSHLRRQQEQARAWQEEAALLGKRLEEAQARLAQADQAVAEAEAAQDRLTRLGEQLGELDTRRGHLQKEGDNYKARIAQLQEVTDAECPLCGQPLTEEHKQAILEQWEAQLETLRQAYKAANDQIGALRDEYEKASAAAARLPALRREHQSAVEAVESLRAKRAALEKSLASWEQEGRPRLQEIQARLEAANFAPEERRALQALDERLKALGYDPEAHEAARRAEANYRHAEADLRTLESARASLQHLEREITDLRAQAQSLEGQIAALRERRDEASRKLEQARKEAGDVEKAERKLADLRERIGELQKSHGGLQQQLHLIAKYKCDLKALTAERLALAHKTGHYKQLEEAFGRNGIPALLIEQSLPLLEAEANRLLERLTDGQMNIRFRTQRPYKDASRKDLRETLDIIISDAYGQRDYESYSGGEAFRVDFAIRVALARLLAHRAGARLQTLVIDEGFGGQDAEGRQRLVEAIRAVQSEFAKILVITHIEELKEAFPARIEVHKTPEGSRAQVVLL